jgi:hypothetical protein
MTKEEAIKEIEKVFVPAFANYIITALTEGATVSDKEQGTAYMQAIYTEALEEGIRCAMCTNTIKSDTGCDGGCIVDTKMYNKVMTEINNRLLRRPPRKGHWEVVSDGYSDNAYICECSECKDTVWVYKDADRNGTIARIAV